jgi:hypothetical protein
MHAHQLAKEAVVYDPSVGRWLEQDPIGFSAGDMNLYRYVGNSPTNATDPSGMDRESLVGKIKADGNYGIPTRAELEAEWDRLVMLRPFVNPSSPEQRMLFARARELKTLLRKYDVLDAIDEKRNALFRKRTSLQKLKEREQAGYDAYLKHGWENPPPLTKALQVYNERQQMMLAHVRAQKTFDSDLAHVQGQIKTIQEERHRAQADLEADSALKQHHIFMRVRWAIHPRTGEMKEIWVQNTSQNFRDMITKQWISEGWWVFTHNSQGQLVQLDPAVAFAPVDEELGRWMWRRRLELLNTDPLTRTPIVDKIQIVLDVASLVPVIGTPAALASGAISACRGDVLGASLSFLAAVPAFSEAGLAKFARFGLKESALLGKGSKAAKATESLHAIDDLTKITKATERAQLNLAAALESGIIREDQASVMLQKSGLSLSRADEIIAEAKATMARVGKKHPEAALIRQFFNEVRSGSAVPWQKITKAVKEEAVPLDKKILDAFRVKRLRTNYEYVLNENDLILNEAQLLALSELKGVEHSLTILEDGNQILVRGLKDRVNQIIERESLGRTKQLVHTQPGIREVVPSLDDLLFDYPVKIIARGDKGSVVWLDFSVDEVKQLRSLLDPADPTKVVQMRKKFYETMVKKCRDKGIEPPESMKAAMSDLNMALP